MTTKRWFPLRLGRMGYGCGGWVGACRRRRLYHDSIALARTPDATHHLLQQRRRRELCACVRDVAKRRCHGLRTLAPQAKSTFHGRRALLKGVAQQESHGIV